jgi:hypothetical protein
LYFDIDQVGDYKNEDAKLLFKEISEINDLLFEVKLYQSSLENENDPKAKERIKHIIESYMPRFKEKLIALNVHFEKIELFYSKIIQAIRTELFEHVK